MDNKFSVIMDRILLAIFVIFVLLSDISGASAKQVKNVLPCLPEAEPDTIVDKQLLFNGRLWRNLYYNIRGGEFLFTQDWLTGNVIINEVTFKNVLLRYDIYNDQLLTMINRGAFIQLNKELIKGFTLLYQSIPNNFENFGSGTEPSVNGFAQIIYKGKTSLLLKQKKQIKKLAVENKYDEFYQTDILYILKDGNFSRISGKKDMINVLSDRREQIKSFIRDNKIRVRKKRPASFCPVLEFYDSLK
jgi:hypothetical protein